jgi:hypothetical protein
LDSVHYQSLFKLICFGNWFYCCYHVHRVWKIAYSVGPTCRFQ